MSRRYFAFLLCAATVPAIDQSLGTQTVSGAGISPDGTYIACLVQQGSAK